MPVFTQFLTRRGFLVRLSALGLTAPLMAASEKPGKTMLFFGDSLTAGYGLDEPSTTAYPALIGEKMLARHADWKTMNAGLSGETTSGGLRRIDWVLRQPVDLFFLALGGNDGLRGIPVSLTESNLKAIIEKVRAKNPGVTVVLAGMKMPVSMGEYAADFEAVFSKIAAGDPEVVLLPFLLDGVGGVASMNQPDAIHPNAEGHVRVADHAWKVLGPLLKK